MRACARASACLSVCACVRVFVFMCAPYQTSVCVCVWMGGCVRARVRACVRNNYVMMTMMLMMMVSGGRADEWAGGRVCVYVYVCVSVCVVMGPCREPPITQVCAQACARESSRRMRAHA